MNIFVLSENIKECAQMHVDKHVVKMILEHCQMLSTSYNLSGGVGPYKPTHVNHPCSVWVRSSLENWKWLFDLTKELDIERQFRFGSNKEHKSLSKIKDHLSQFGYPSITSGILTPFAQAMPTHCRDKDAVTAYRKYYRMEKQHLYSWSHRSVPEFIFEDDSFLYERS